MTGTLSESARDRQKMIEENLGLVHSCAHRFKGRGIEYDDLFQAGCMGLVKAADGSQKPLIVTKTEPEIRGVVVVSRGGGDPKMREKIVEAVKTALDLSSTQVCVVGYSEYTYGNE